MLNFRCFVAVLKSTPVLKSTTGKIKIPDGAQKEAELNFLH